MKAIEMFNLLVSDCKKMLEFLEKEIKENGTNNDIESLKSDLSEIKVVGGTLELPGFRSPSTSQKIKIAVSVTQYVCELRELARQIYRERRKSKELQRIFNMTMDMKCRYESYILELEEDEMHIQLSDGWMMSLEDLVWDYERLRKESKKKENTFEIKEDKSTTLKLKVGEWFLIDREVINRNKEKIRRKCNEVGTEGKLLWERFEKSNKVADENPQQYPRLIETYIFKHNWKYRTEQEMRDMCEEIGNGMCDEVICDLELQMRICNGESVHYLVKESDELPRVRVIKLKNGGTGYFGGGANNFIDNPPSNLIKKSFRPTSRVPLCTPYAFR